MSLVGESGGPQGGLQKLSLLGTAPKKRSWSVFGYLRYSPKRNKETNKETNIGRSEGEGSCHSMSAS